MADTKLILVCKDKPTLDDVVKILTASGKIAENEIEAWEEKIERWDKGHSYCADNKSLCLWL